MVISWNQVTERGREDSYTYRLHSAQERGAFLRFVVLIARVELEDMMEVKKGKGKQGSAKKDMKEKGKVK